MQSPAKVAVLLFGSGFCALVYQTAWLRQFRLIFGASTFATAAVLAIFMAGLGIGSALLGKRADAHPRPLVFYGNLELLIAATAALSPLLLWIVARIYFATGGSVTLGTAGASVVRLLLSLLVLGVPTVMMGGTLPAAARAVESSDDAGRRRLALLYGTNTLGAVAGALASTFFMLETFGNRQTLFIAVLVNAIVAIVARSLGRTSAAPLGASDSGLRTQDSALPPNAVLAASAIVGFAFLLMELVWYRMLAPLLGGSTFTFGLILAIALLGIGLGGAAYSFWSGTRRATAGGFALTCSLEAAAIALPFALGDRLAIGENFLRGLGTQGFGGFVIAWTLLTLVVVFPAAFIAGMQFPLLISLLGEGRDEVGRQVGLAYAWNTAGAIAGSLAGGFGLLPILTAPGTWRLVIVLLALLGIGALLYAMRQRQRVAAGVAAAIAVAAIAANFALGPTAVWRHSGIGVGRANIPDSVNATREWVNSTRRDIAWDEDGRESSVALSAGSEYAFIVNGKADGSARGDAGTQVMSAMVGATLHPNPQRALVIGLGTGSSAGWLGAIPGMQRVDAVELEPAVLRVAAACSSVNHDVLHNAKVRIHIADAREVLLTTPERYDIIFSEPSNPYRAGIASLFTQEFYRASAARLRPGGYFLQWVQAYEVDSETIRQIYATIGGVFPYVETWTTDTGDLLLLASQQPVRHDVAALRARVAAEPFRSAISNAWRVESVEGFLAHFLARDTFARAIARSEPDVNTDDRTLVEFGFARGVEGFGRFDMNELTGLARTRGEDRPVLVNGTIDWNLYYANRATLQYVDALPQNASPELSARHRAAADYDNRKLDAVLSAWRAQPWAPVNSGELAMLAEALADAGDPNATQFTRALRPLRPADADAIDARLLYRQANIPGAAALLERAFVFCRRDPWATIDVIGRALDVALQVAKQRPYGQQMYAALAQPFAAGLWNDTRRVYLALIGRDLDGCGPRALTALRALEPWPPFRADMLQARVDCYGSTMLGGLAKRARRDHDDFIDAQPIPLASGVR